MDESTAPPGVLQALGGTNNPGLYRVSQTSLFAGVSRAATPIPGADAPATPGNGPEAPPRPAYALTGPECPPPCGTAFPKRGEWIRGDRARCPRCTRVATFIAAGLWNFEAPPRLEEPRDAGEHVEPLAPVPPLAIDEPLTPAEPRTVAVLCVARNSYYHVLPGVDPYDARRDARTYIDDFPVIGHPPCRKWSAFVAATSTGTKEERDLGPFVVAHLKRCGGILEHPAHSLLWDYCRLPKPWEKSRDGMFTLEVSQGWWGHPCPKRTWLCFFHIDRAAVDLPPATPEARNARLRWGKMSSQQRSATPPRFAEWLVETARFATPPKEKGK